MALQDTAAQTSLAPTGGPARSQAVIDPIVDDLVELFAFCKEVVKENALLWLEIKRLQPAQLIVGPAGAGITLSGADSYIIVTPVTGGYTIGFGGGTTSINACPDPITVVTPP